MQFTLKPREHPGGKLSDQELRDHTSLLEDFSAGFSEQQILKLRHLAKKMRAGPLFSEP